MFCTSWTAAPDAELHVSPPSRDFLHTGDAVDHDGPAAMTVAQAHAAMQTHLRCLSQQCPHRRAALAVLVGTGQYVLPDIPASWQAVATALER